MGETELLVIDSSPGTFTSAGARSPLVSRPPRPAQQFPKRGASTTSGRPRGVGRQRDTSAAASLHRPAIPPNCPLELVCPPRPSTAANSLAKPFLSLPSGAFSFPWSCLSSHAVQQSSGTSVRKPWDKRAANRGLLSSGEFICTGKLM